LKWNRRKERINLNKLIIKFNDQNDCDYEDILAFENLKFKNKVCFTGSKYRFKSTTYVNQGKDRIKSDMNFFYSPINIINYINDMQLESN
jgi:uncharacterized protein (DUF1919 family)